MPRSNHRAGPLRSVGACYGAGIVVGALVMAPGGKSGETLAGAPGPRSARRALNQLKRLSGCKIPAAGRGAWFDSCITTAAGALCQWYRQEWRAKCAASACLVRVVRASPICVSRLCPACIADGPPGRMDAWSGSGSGDGQAVSGDGVTVEEFRSRNIGTCATYAIAARHMADFGRFHSHAISGWRCNSTAGFLSGIASMIYGRTVPVRAGQKWQQFLNGQIERSLFPVCGVSSWWITLTARAVMRHVSSLLLPNSTPISSALPTQRLCPANVISLLSYCTRWTDVNLTYRQGIALVSRNFGSRMLDQALKSSKWSCFISFALIISGRHFISSPRNIMHFITPH